MQKQNKKAGVLAVLTAEVIFGFSFLFTKTATNSVSALSLLSWRFVLAAVSFTLLCRAGLFHVDFRGKNIKHAVFLASLHPVAYFLCENNGIRLTSASESGIIIATLPVFTILFSIVFLKKTPSKKEVLGILMTVMGVIVIVLATRTRPTFNLLGYLLLFGCVIAYCLFALFAYKDAEFTSTEKAYMMICTGAAAFTVLALIEQITTGNFGAFIRLPFTNRSFLFAILYLGIGSSIIAFTCNNYGLSALGTTAASSFAGLTTLVTVLAGVLILREPFSLIQGVGTVLILAGVFIANSGGNEG